MKVFVIIGPFDEVVGVYSSMEKAIGEIDDKGLSMRLFEIQEVELDGEIGKEKR